DFLDEVDAVTAGQIDVEDNQIPRIPTNEIHGGRCIANACGFEFWEGVAQYGLDAATDGSVVVYEERLHAQTGCLSSAAVCLGMRRVTTVPLSAAVVIV